MQCPGRAWKLYCYVLADNPKRLKAIAGSTGTFSDLLFAIGETPSELLIELLACNHQCPRLQFVIWIACMLPDRFVKELAAAERLVQGKHKITTRDFSANLE